MSSLDVSPLSPVSEAPHAVLPLSVHDAMPPAMAARTHLTIRASSGWAAINFKELWQFRDLLLSFAWRDLKLRYKQTALGITWVALQPLLAAGVFSFVFGKVAKMPSNGLPYFLFSFAGLLGWNIVSNTLTRVSICLVGNSQLISKVYFPRLIMPLSAVPSVLIDFVVGAGMMVCLMALYRVRPTAAIFLLPLWVGVTLMLALGFGLMCASLMVRYRDVQYILPVILQVLLYASPVAYSLWAVPQNLRGVFLLNPLSAPLEAFRATLLGTPFPPLAWLSFSIALAVVTFGLGAFWFKRMERSFADVI